MYVDKVKLFTQINKAKDARTTAYHVKENHRLALATQKLMHKMEVGKLRVNLATSKLTIDSREDKIKRLEH